MTVENAIGLILDLGADDYVTKPFDMFELLARLRAATRRSGSDPQRAATVTFGPAVIDLDAKTASRTDVAGTDDRSGPRPVHLTPTEWQLLEALLRSPGRLVTQRQLLTLLRGTPEHTDSSYLRIYMAQLRKKLEAEPGRPRHLLTEPGMGYRYSP